MNKSTRYSPEVRERAVCQQEYKRDNPRFTIIPGTGARQGTLDARSRIRFSK
jgi:hypothetical protein